jgi:RNA polymerase sigma-70 factor (ECF subfamily)
MPVASAIERYHAPLLSYATRLMGDRERARDVVQDTFMRLCEAAEQVDEDRLGAWLYTVCRNRAIDVRRRDARLSPLDASPEPAVDSAAEVSREVTEVFEQLGDLSEPKVRVLSLRYRDGLSYQRISELTGLSVGNVGFVLHSAVVTLRKHLAVVVLVLAAGALLQSERLPSERAERARLEPAVDVEAPRRALLEVVKSHQARIRAAWEQKREQQRRKAAEGAAPSGHPRALPATRPPTDARQPSQGGGRSGGTAAPKVLMGSDPWDSGR